MQPGDVLVCPRIIAWKLQDYELRHSDSSKPLSLGKHPLLVLSVTGPTESHDIDIVTVTAWSRHGVLIILGRDIPASEL